jgi:hypothetical protein
VADDPSLRLAGSARDLAVFAERAARHDPGTPVRLVAADGVVAAFATTPFDCLGLRVTRLAEDAAVDMVVEAVGLAARARGERDGVLALPPRLPDITWSTPLPPRSGWAEVARLPVSAVVGRVGSDTAEFKRRAGQGSPGSGVPAALEAVAADLWARPFVADAPARLAHASEYLGFLVDDDEVVVRAAGPWRRLDATGGVVLARVLDPLGLLVG